MWAGGLDFGNHLAHFPPLGVWRNLLRKKKSRECHCVLQVLKLGQLVRMRRRRRRRVVVDGGVCRRHVPLAPAFAAAAENFLAKVEQTEEGGEEADNQHGADDNDGDAPRRQLAEALRLAAGLTLLEEGIAATH
jgi:hypothetical protein